MKLDFPTVRIAELVEKEQAAGVMFGPFHRSWLHERAPEKVRRHLERARHDQYRMMARQGFASADTNDVNTAAFGARNTSAAELNILQDGAAGASAATTQAIINQYCAIPANDARAGKAYQVTAGGTYGNTGTPTMIWTPRWGSSTTPATNISLGASATFTSITGTTGLPYFIQFTFGIRTAPPGTTVGTGKGFGEISMQIPVTSSQLAATLLIGGTAATIDTSGQGAAGCGLTMNLTWSASSASNTSTCEFWLLQSLN